MKQTNQQEIRDEIEMTLHDLLNYKIFSLGEVEVTPSTLLVFGLIIVATFWVSWLAQRGVDKALRLRGIDHAGTIGAARRLLHYAVMLIGLGIALQTIGIQLQAFFAAGAIFAVAIGFAMQNVVQNFVSGVILLVERTIKPGDVLEVDGLRVRVEKMGIRATIVRTKDEEEMIVPNSVLVSSTVKNFTLRDGSYRVRVVVGVTYSSDMRKVETCLRETATAIDWRLQDKPPEIYLTAFADSSVNWEVSVWIPDPWTFQRRRSDLHKAIWWALEDAGVVIAFPQLDLHLDPPVVEALGGNRTQLTAPQ